jgi:hypothetical protein
MTKGLSYPLVWGYLTILMIQRAGIYSACTINPVRIGRCLMLMSKVKMRHRILIINIYAIIFSNHIFKSNNKLGM